MGEGEEKVVNQPLSRDQFFAAKDLRYEAVELPNNGGTVFVRTMTARERFEVEDYLQRWKEVQEDTSKDNDVEAVKLMNEVRAKVIIDTLCDKDGNPLLTKEDAGALMGRSVETLDLLFDTAMRLAKLKKTELDQEVGNSSAGPS